MSSVAHVVESGEAGIVSASRWRVYVGVAVCIAIAMLDGFDVQAAGLAAPLFRAEFDLGAVQTGQIFSAAQVGFVLGALIGGALSDRIGRRNTLLLGTCIMGLFALVTALSGGFLPLLAGRFLTGIGIGIIVVNLISVVTEIAPSQHRAKLVSLALAGLPLGGALAAVVGHEVIDHGGWRMLFVTGGILPLIVAPMLLVIPNRRTGHNIVESNQVNWGEALFGHGRAVPTLLLWLALFLGSCVLYLVVNWLPTLMTQRGHDIAFAHGASAVFSIGGSIGAVIIGVLVDRFGYRLVLPPCFASIIVGIAGLAFFDLPNLIRASAFLTGFLVLGTGYSLFSLAPFVYPSTARGTGTGVAVAVGRAGSIVGPLLGGYLLAVSTSAASGAINVLLATVPLSLASALAAFVLTRRVNLDE